MSNSSQASNPLPVTVRHIRRILRGNIVLRAAIGCSLLAWYPLTLVYPFLDDLFVFQHGRAWLTGCGLLIADLVILWLLRRVERRDRMLDGPAWRHLLILQIIIDEGALAILVLSGPGNFSLVNGLLLHAGLTAALLRPVAALSYALLTSILAGTLGYTTLRLGLGDLNTVIRHLAVFFPLLLTITMLQLYLTHLREESYRFMEESLNELAAFNTQRTKFLLNLTHHIKTPLAVIQTYSRMMLDGMYGDLPQDAREPLDKMVYRTDGAIRHLMSVVRLTNLDSQVFLDERRENFCCSEVVPLLISRLGLEARVTTNFDSPPDDCRIWGILDHFILMLELLLDNAARYSPETERIELHLKLENRMLSIRVSDKGIGIPAEHQAKIFSEYFRTKEAARLWPAGAGLSLAICRRIQQLNHCQFKVISSPGEGTTMQVLWPIDSKCGKESSTSA